jgi:hypothetical protein
VIALIVVSVVIWAVWLTLAFTVSGLVWRSPLGRLVSRMWAGPTPRLNPAEGVNNYEHSHV